MKALFGGALCDVERVAVRRIYLRQRLYEIGYVGFVTGQPGADGMRVYGDVQDLATQEKSQVPSPKTQVKDSFF